MTCLPSLDDVQAQLSRHLLRTACTDIVNLTVNLLAADHMLAVNDESALTPEVRLKYTIYQFIQARKEDNNRLLWTYMRDNFNL